MYLFFSQESSKSSAGSPVPSRAPPRSEWVPNEAKAECQCCSLVVFSMFNRRHHCRRCGRVVCHGCSTKTLQVCLIKFILLIIFNSRSNQKLVFLYLSLHIRRLYPLRR